MNKMSKIYCIGELLLDCMRDEQAEGLTFRMLPGGAPGNVAAAVARLGGDSVYLGKIANDIFGDFLIERLSAAGTCMTNIVRTDIEQTSLAFVSFDAQRNRRFSFYRENAADLAFSPDELDCSAFQSGDALHFGSLGLLKSPQRESHDKAIRAMREVKGVVSFDVNIRESLCADKAVYRELVHHYLAFADIIKVSDEDLCFLLSTNDLAAHLTFLSGFSDKLILFTRGAAPLRLWINGQWLEIPAFSVPAVDTTGAGDSFLGAYLHQVSVSGLPGDAETAAAYARVAHAAAALTVQRYGALDAMPDKQQIDAFLQQQHSAFT